MKSSPRTWTRLALWALFSALFFAPFASAQGRDEYGEVGQTVARISYISGQVSFARGDDPNNWQPADRNVPMTLGDRVYSGSRSRLELQVQGGDFVRLGARSDLAALNLTDDTKQFSLRVGVASFQIRRLSESEIFEVDTPNAAVTFERPGSYRIDVDENGNTRVAVRTGSVTVAAGGGQIPLNAGEEIEIEGIDSPRYGIVGLAALDGWDQWVAQRESRITRARSYQYVSADVVGVDDLDEYGRWENVPQYGRCWTPTSVAVDWVPYRAGHWIWQDPWGWTWVSSEPWGWAPYHYGRWAYASSRWYWVPVAPSVRLVAYSPALVAFVGGGLGWSASVSVGGGGFIGWFPLGPSDPFSPWWGARVSAGVTVPSVTYVNRTYVTVLSRNTFVSGGLVTNNFVRDRTVVSQVSAAPVLRGPIPAVPTQGALHVAASTNVAAAPPPPTALATRTVVARVAPPPAPPTFQAKLAVISENRGAPVAPAAAARISVEKRGRPQAAAEVRPVASEPGRVTLAPRNGNAAGAAERRPEPVTASRGRPMATADRPVVANPVTGSAPPSAAPPAREAAPRRVVPPGREVAPGQAAPPSEAPRAPAPERGRERQITPPPERPVEQPAERGRPQNEEWRQRARPAQAAPAQAPSPTVERQRERPAQAAPAQPPPPAVERQRERPAQAQPAQAPPPTVGQQRERPAQAPPPAAERSREQPPPPPPAVRERPPEAAPPAREARPEAPKASQAPQQKPEEKKEQKDKKQTPKPKEDEKKKEEKKPE